MHMYFHVHVYIHALLHVHAFTCIHVRSSFFHGESDCLGCVVLLCLVVCMTLLASFFLLYLSLTRDEPQLADFQTTTVHVHVYNYMYMYIHVHIHVVYTYM